MESLFLPRVGELGWPLLAPWKLNKLTPLGCPTPAFPLKTKIKTKTKRIWGWRDWSQIASPECLKNGFRVLLEWFGNNVGLSYPVFAWG